MAPLREETDADFQALTSPSPKMSEAAMGLQIDVVKQLQAKSWPNHKVQSSATVADLQTNKENLQLSMADSIKTTRRMAIKRYVSPPVPTKSAKTISREAKLDPSHASSPLKRKRQPNGEDLVRTKGAHASRPKLEHKLEGAREQHPRKGSFESSSSQTPRATANSVSAHETGSSADELDVIVVSPRREQSSQSIQPAIVEQTPSLEKSRDPHEDERFVEEVKASLKKQSKWKTANVGRRQAGRILKLLQLAKTPIDEEALFLSGEEAAEQVQPNTFFPGIIVAEGQQALPLQTSKDFLNEYYDDEAEVFIQDPSVELAKNASTARPITVGKLKDRLYNPPTKPSIPWNCLELATHVEDGLRPAFLNNEDCRLLTKLKLPSTNDKAGRRNYLPGWKEVEKWALVAQGGALTEPHQDSHGYSTYITLNQGIMGFGWLANPTEAERKEWCAGPSSFTGGRWRYVILRPGQTIFFPSGTVHFVFRLKSTGDTLAFGGHVLRCSQIVRWVKTMLEEKAAPNITNEDITVSAPAYLERVEKFVQQALATGHAEKWGREEAVQEFLRLKEEFLKD